MTNNNCFKFEKLIFNNSLLSKEVDATYIIHLEGNGRYESIKEQLIEYNPTNITYILFNKGFKKCKKESYIKLPGQDLINSYIKVFKHAESLNYNNILILEDDFIFDKKIKDKYHIDNILYFLKKHKNKKFLYLLGSIPFLQTPYYFTTYLNLSSIGTHAVIYSKLLRDEILKKDEKNIKDWDTFNSYNYMFYRYGYYTPLCYQLFTDTDNSKHWGNELGLFQFIPQNFFKILKYLNLDKKVEPGYSIFYSLSILFYILFLIIILYIFYILYKLLLNIINKKIKKYK